jgi:lactate dehydrogenase-like 2-hydroxyacid dehydrogenase
MDIIYHNRHAMKKQKRIWEPNMSFDELIEQSDVLSIHANFKPEQNELFNASVFDKMKKNAIFINTARGGFIIRKIFTMRFLSTKSGEPDWMLPIRNQFLKMILF